MIDKCKWGFALPVLAACLSLVSTLPAQNVTGTIRGTVQDGTGSVVPNATIVITNDDTGVVRNSATTGDGIYTVPSLTPGKYTVAAKAEGFSTAEAKNVVVTVGSDTRIDLMLQVGSTTQNVEVTVSAATIETSSAEVSQLMDQNLIADTPLNTRDIQQLAVIQPGVQYNNYSPFGKQLSVVGDRPTHNRYLQEGTDLTWTYRTAANSLPSGILLGVEAVKEFRFLRRISRQNTENCRAASLTLHLNPERTAFMEARTSFIATARSTRRTSSIAGFRWRDSNWARRRSTAISLALHSAGRSVRIVRSSS